MGQKAQETDRPQVSEEEDIIGKCASTKKKSDNVLNLDILEALRFQTNQRNIRFRGKRLAKRKILRHDLSDLSVMLLLLSNRRLCRA